MATQNLVSFKKTSIRPPIKSTSGPAIADSFIKDEAGLSFHRKVIVLGGGADGGDCIEMRPELLKPPGLEHLEYAQAIASNLKSHNEKAIRALAELVLVHLGEGWILKKSEIKNFMTLSSKDFGLIQAAHDRGFSLTGFGKSLHFHRSMPTAISFTLNEMGRLKYCDPEEVRDLAQPLRINPYPVDLGEGFQIVQELKTLRVQQFKDGGLAWVSKPYKTFRGARNCAQRELDLLADESASD